MTDGDEATHSSIASSEQVFVLSALERDQLAEAKKQHIPRRPLKGIEIIVLSALRIYLYL